MAAKQARGFFGRSVLWTVVFVTRGASLFTWSGVEAKEESQTSKFILMDKPRTWTDARKACFSEGGRLAVVTSEGTVNQLFEVAKHSKLEDPIWIGQYQKFTPWIVSKGCYSIVGNVSIQTDLGSHNGVVQCMELCSNSTYFALQGEICHCLKAHTLLKEIRTRRCDVPCPSNDEDMCGGDNELSLYKKARNLQIGGGHGHCASMLMQDNDSVITVAKNCNEELPYICAGTGSWISRWKLYVSDEDLNWQGSRLACRDNGRKLASDADNNRYRWAAYMDKEIFYWISVFRQARIFLDDGQVNVTADRCMALYLNETGHVKLQEDNCTAEKLSFCELEFINTTQVSIYPSSQSASISNAPVGVIVGTLVAVLVCIVLVSVVIITVLLKRKRKLNKKIVQFERFSNSVSGSICPSADECHQADDGHYDELHFHNDYVNQPEDSPEIPTDLHESTSAAYLYPRVANQETDPADTYYSCTDLVAGHYEDINTIVYENQNPSDSQVLPNDYERLDQCTRQTRDYDSLQFHHG